MTDSEHGEVSCRVTTRPMLMLAGALALVDQLTKVLANARLTYAEAHSVFPGFDLLLVYNRGAAFSFLNDAGGWQRWILSAISLGVSVFLIVWLFRIPMRLRLLRLSVAVILGGALGNLYDRLQFGYVVDFISLHVGAWRFATFNIADAAITIGAILLMLDIVVTREAPRNG